MSWNKLEKWVKRGLYVGKGFIDLQPLKEAALTCIMVVNLVYWVGDFLDGFLRGYKIRKKFKKVLVGKKNRLLLQPL